MTRETDGIAKGVEAAWDFWLSQHDVSTPMLIEDAIRAAFRSWLDDHTDQLIAAIAAQAGRQLPPIEPEDSSSEGE